MCLLILAAAGTAQTPLAPSNIQVGQRPWFLTMHMAHGLLKDKLQSCANGPVTRTDFSVGHRGAALMLPEHTEGL